MRLLLPDTTSAGRAAVPRPGAAAGLNFEALDVVPERPEGRDTGAEFERAADGAAKGRRAEGPLETWGPCGGAVGGDAAERR